MDSVKQYLLSVICGAMVCAIVSSLTNQKGSKAALLKLVTGIFLAFTVISPITRIQLEKLTIFTEELQEEASFAAAFGQSVAEESRSGLIKSKMEAYILDKAATLNTSLSVEVILDECFYPESVKLQGNIAPYARFRLESILEEELGIATETQEWIG